MSIHPTSIIDPSAKIAKDVQIGPFCTIGEDVQKQN
jgi:UDP-N-acetylglucosamine acyltransferase